MFDLKYRTKGGYRGGIPSRWGFFGAKRDGLGSFAGAASRLELQKFPNSARQTPCESVAEPRDKGLRPQAGRAPAPQGYLTTWVWEVLSIMRLAY